MADDSEFDLVTRLDELAEAYRERLREDASLAPEAFAREHGDVPAGDLLPVLQGLFALGRSSQQHLGPFLTGDQVGPYRITGIIGRGGMGIVYDAVETGLGRRVALKALHGVDPDERAQKRFEREARAAASLDHPAIVPVLGSGQTRGVLWYAMRRVDGQGLDRVMSSLDPAQPEPLRRSAIAQLEGSSATASHSQASVTAARLPARARSSAWITHRLAEALTYAHSQGVLHRDIKPANVLLDRGGSPSLADFGLCKIEGDQSLTQEVDIVGTLRYMPPEALEGNFDQRGDVYGLGLVLYELAAGRPAFGGNSKQSVIHEVLHVTPPPLRRVDREMPEDLERITLKAIAKAPEERYPTALEFATDLEALLTGKPVRARRPSPFYLLGLFVRRNRALAATLIATTALVALASTFYLVQLQIAFGETRDALAEAERHAARASIAAAESTLRAGDVSSASSLLRDVPESRRGWMWRHLAQRAGTADGQTGLQVGAGHGLACSADSALLAAFGPAGIEIRDRRDLRLIRRIDRGALDAAFVDDGNGLVALQDSPRSLIHVDLANGEVTVTRPLTRKYTRLKARPGSELAVLLRGTHDLEGVNWRSGETLWSETIRIPWINAYELLNERTVILGGADGDICRYEIESGRTVRLPGHPGEVTALLVQDGRLLASGAADGSVLLHPALTGHGIVALDLEGVVTCFARARAEPQVVAAGLDNRAIAILDARIGVAITSVAGLETTPRGLHLGGEPWLVAVGAGGVLASSERSAHDGRIDLTPAMGTLREIGSSSDSRWLAALSTDGMLWLHDLVSGVAEVHPSVAHGSASRPTFAPAGSHFAIGSSIRSLPSGALVAETGRHSEDHSVFLDDGTLRGIGVHGGSLQAWRWDAGDAAVDFEPIAIPKGDRVISLIACPSQDALYVALHPGVLLRLRASDMTAVWIRAADHDIRDIAHRPATGQLYSASADGLVRVHDDETGTERAAMSWRASPANSSSSSLRSITAGPALGLVTTCTEDGRVDAWEASTGRRVGGLCEAGSRLRHVTRVAGTDWLAASGQGGRIVLLGAGTPPTSPRLVSDGGLAPPEVVARCIELSRRIEPMLVAIRQSSRLPASRWRDRALEALAAKLR